MEFKKKEKEKQTKEEIHSDCLLVAAIFVVLLETNWKPHFFS